jgi:hypothetical protein
MSSKIEYADRARGDGSFPARWGRPPTGDEQRSSWIAENVRAEQADPVRRLRQLERRYHN